MLVPKVQLIPSPEQVTDLLRETGALREGHFEFPTGLHSTHYFQMPLVMRYHGNARVLNVALSRLLRMEHEVLAALPHCAIVAPAAGGIPVAFGVREAGCGADFLGGKAERKIQPSAISRCTRPAMHP